MRSALLALNLWFTPAAYAAFEATREVAPTAAAHDPLAPRALFWLANPATLAWARPQAAAGHVRPYAVDGLAISLAGAAGHTRLVALGLAISALSDRSGYRESDLGASASWRGGAALAFGATAHLYGVHAGARFAPLWRTGFDFGVRYGGKGGFGAGFCAADLFASAVGGRALIRPAYRGALSYRPTPLSALRLGLTYRDRCELSLGETILAADILHLRADLVWAPLRLLVGLRLKLGRMFMEVSHRDHPELGSDRLWLLGMDL